MVKRNRLPLVDSPIFSSRGVDVKWPTLRGAYLTDETVAILKNLAFGVVFLDGPYNTRLNFGNSSEYTNDDGSERAIFFEHLHKVDGDHIFLLCWIGNYYAGSIFHCAWQFPQHLHWPVDKLEQAAFKTYKRIANVMYRPFGEMDNEVSDFISQKVNP